MGHLKAQRPTPTPAPQPSASVPVLVVDEMVIPAAAQMAMEQSPVLLHEEGAQTQSQEVDG